MKYAYMQFFECMAMLKATLTALTLLTGSLTVPSAGAAELLMLEQDGCAWCDRWNEEIGDIYPKTAEARRAPLRRVDIDEPWPADLAAIARDPFTPTFILVSEGREIDRMRGYAGDEFFWFLLGEMLEKLADETVE